MKVGHKSKNKRHATTTNDRSTGGSFIRGLVSGAVFCLAVLLLGYMFMNIRTEKLPPDGIAPLTDLLDPPTAATSTAEITPLSELLSPDNRTPSSPSPITAVHAIDARPLKQRQTGDGMVLPAVITTTVGTVESTAGSSSSSGSSHLRTSASSSSSSSSGTSSTSSSSSNSNSISRSSKSFTDLPKMNISSLLPHYTKVTQPTLHPLSTF